VRTYEHAEKTTKHRIHVERERAKTAIKLLTGSNEDYDIILNGKTHSLRGP
jgi:hypothetical protein